MARLTALWKKEFLAISRDRHGLAALFIMPAVFILIMSLALANAFSGQQDATLGYAVLDLDGTALSKELDGSLGPLEMLEKRPPPATEEQAREQVLSGKIAFVAIIPEGFAKQIGTKQTPALRFLVDPAIPGMLRNGFCQYVEAKTIRVWLGHVLERLGQSAMLPGIRAVADQVGTPEVSVEAVGHAATAGALPSAVQQNVPAWLIFSMFFVVIPISAVFIGERQRGTLQRLRSQRVPFWLILAGKCLPYVLINQAQAIVMVAVGKWMVPLCGGDALVLPEGTAALTALWLVSLAVSIAAVGLALLIARIAHSIEQATIVGGVGNILMGALGGIMVPRFVMPATMQPWTRLSPMDWALEGFHQIMLRQGRIGDILFPVGALVCFGFATLALAVFLERRAHPT